MLKKMTKKQKKQFYKIVAAFVLLIVGVILPIPELSIYGSSHFKAG